MTYFIDCYSRMVMGWMVSVRQSSDAVLEALRDAILHRPRGGHVRTAARPGLMYDNGLTFLAEVVQEAAALLDFRTQPVAPYSPHRNGKVERCHQTICRSALSEMPAWNHGPRDLRAPVCDTPISEKELIAEIDARRAPLQLRAAAQRDRRPHAVAGFAERRDGAAPRRTAPRLRFALRHRKIQKVSAHGRLQARPLVLGTSSSTPASATASIVAWLRKDERSVDVYTLERRVPVQPPAARDARRARRSWPPSAASASARPRRTSGCARRSPQAQERYAPTNQPDGLNVITLSADRTASRAQATPTATRTRCSTARDSPDGAVWPWRPEGRAVVIEHYLQLKDARVVNTPVPLALANMRDVRRRRAITLFCGDPGVGKTIAAQAIAESFADGEGCVVKLTTAPQPADDRQRDPRAAHRRLARRDALGGRAHAEPSCGSGPAGHRRRGPEPGLDCIEWLRWLHEEVPGRLTLLFVGGPQVRARLMRSPQLTRRIFQPTAFRALPASRGDRDDPLVSSDLRGRRRTS